jgi:hypothetical protein
VSSQSSYVETLIPDPIVGLGAFERQYIHKSLHYKIRAFIMRGSRELLPLSLSLCPLPCDDTAREWSSANQKVNPHPTHGVLDFPACRPVRNRFLV